MLCSSSKNVVVCFTITSNVAVTTRVSVKNVRADSFPFSFHYKDFLKKKSRSDIGYKYTCSNYKAIYNGKTYHLFFTRHAELMGITSLTGKHLKTVKQSSVFVYLLECSFLIDFDHFDILASDQNKLRIFVKESLLIKRDQPQSNKTIESFLLKLVE